MKLIFTYLFAVLIFSATAQQIPNAGFETWVAGNSFVTELPAGWVASGTFPSVIKSTDAHNGNYAMKLKVAPYFTGVGADQMSYAFSVPSSTSQPLYYTYWAKIHLSGSDAFVTNAYLTNTGSTLNVTDLDYAHSYLRAANNTDVWKQFSFPMNTSGPGAYDSITLRFYFPTELDTSSYVIVDDLAFSQNPAGIENITAESTIESVYPNPAQSMATVEYTINDRADVKLEVYDLLGTRVSSVVNENQSSGKYRAELTTESLPVGVYLVNLTINGQSHIQKLIVQH